LIPCEQFLLPRNWIIEPTVFKLNRIYLPKSTNFDEIFIEMNIVQGNTGHSHIDPKSLGVGTIPLKTLDSFNYENIDMIKIDVEGFEEEILAGAMNTIKQNKPVLVIEQQKHEYKDDMKETPAIKILESWGYRVVEQFNKDWVLKYQAVPA
jgi:hypothetical protein